MIEALTLWTMV